MTSRGPSDALIISPYVLPTWSQRRAAARTPTASAAAPLPRTTAVGPAFLDEVVVAAAALPVPVAPVPVGVELPEGAAVVVLPELTSALLGSRVPHLAWMVSVQFFWPWASFTLAWMHSEKASWQVNYVEKKNVAVSTRSINAYVRWRGRGQKAGRRGGGWMMHGNSPCTWSECSTGGRGPSHSGMRSCRSGCSADDGD